MDLIIAVDVVLQLISPIYDQAEKDVLSLVYEKLKPKGYFLLELWDFNNLINMIGLANDNVLQLWEEFPPADPFEYGLFSLKIDSNGYIVWDKIFIKRDNNEKSIFSNILKPYSKKQIKNILSEVGYKNVEVFDRWSLFDDGVDGEYIVLVRK
jgi:hypothetical protein